jgi:hypothetical protein
MLTTACVANQPLLFSQQELVQNQGRGDCTPEKRTLGESRDYPLAVSRFAPGSVSGRDVAKYYLVAALHPQLNLRNWRNLRMILLEHI